MDLARLRRSKGFSQRSLGGKAGISPSTIYEIEAGRHSPNPSTILKLSGALGVEPEEVMEAVESPKAPAPPSPEEAAGEERRRAVRTFTSQAETLHAMFANLHNRYVLQEKNPDVRTIVRAEEAVNQLATAFFGFLEKLEEEGYVTETPLRGVLLAILGSEMPPLIEWVRAHPADPQERLILEEDGEPAPIIALVDKTRRDHLAKLGEAA